LADTNLSDGDGDAVLDRLGLMLRTRHAIRDEKFIFAALTATPITAHDTVKRAVIENSRVRIRALETQLAKVLNDR
jgi:hypothetical protein